MSAEAEFLDAFEAGRLVFFVGAGASVDSKVPMPGVVLTASADLFLPSDRRSKRYVDLILGARGVPGQPLKGIQPEVFYGHLLGLCGDREALGLWKILSPLWLERVGEKLSPNANHLAIAEYSARFGVPVFTTNFDVLLEAAAESPQVRARCEVVLPNQTDIWRKPPDRRTLRLFKLHGTIALNGEDRLDTLQTTMETISAVNPSMIEEIGRACEGRALAFVGYSGCDIDYFPVIAGLKLERPAYWFVPFPDVAKVHAHRIAARQIERLPSDFFHELRPTFPARVPGPAAASLLERLKAELPTRLSPGRKRLLLAMCLQSVGRNVQATEVLEQLLSEPSALEPRDLVIGHLALARVEDCRSQYDRSIASARSALKALKLGRHQIGDVEVAGLRSRAIYQTAMARQQRIGPHIRYGHSRLDWRPSLIMMLGLMCEGVWVERQFARLRPRLSATGPPKTSGALHALHAMNDHRLMLIDRIISLLGSLGLTRLRFVQMVLVRTVRTMLDGALATGDYFVYAGALKNIRRLGEGGDQDADAETYSLLRDPLNFALVKRNEAVERLARGERARAAKSFRLALKSARTCGSRATMLKALIGLASCDVASADELALLAALAQQIEGAGYRRYWKVRLKPFLASG